MVVLQKRVELEIRNGFATCAFIDRALISNTPALGSAALVESQHHLALVLESLSGWQACLTIRYERYEYTYATLYVVNAHVTL